MDYPNSININNRSTDSKSYLKLNHPRTSTKAESHVFASSQLASNHRKHKYNEEILVRSVKGANLMREPAQRNIVFLVMEWPIQ